MTPETPSVRWCLTWGCHAGHLCDKHETEARNGD